MENKIKSGNLHIYKVRERERERDRVMVFNATFNNISVMLWRSVLLVEETRVLGENHRPCCKSLTNYNVRITFDLCMRKYAHLKLLTKINIYIYYISDKLLS